MQIQLVFKAEIYTTLGALFFWYMYKVGFTVISVIIVCHLFRGFFVFISFFRNRLDVNNFQHYENK